ncbi:MAG: hypothetical protein WEB05_03045 [Solirubrobacterales bacterium]
MKLVGKLSTAAVLVLALALPSEAVAAGESANAEFTITPMSGPTFFSNAFSAAQGSVDTVIGLPGEPDEYPKITPLKVSDLRFPPASALTFNPKPSMPVCPDSKLGPPPTTNSIPVPEMIARCPGALIGNGTARFALAKNSQAIAARDGDLLIFNGGRVGGLPKIKVYSYSYDLQVGIYTSAILQPDGHLRFEIPTLPVDSAVTAITLSIPGQAILRPKPMLGLTVTLPAGLDRNYLQVKCAGDEGLAWNADYILGERDVGGNPINGPELFLNDSGTIPCTGAEARPVLGTLSVSGPASTVRNRLNAYRVTIRNVGAKATSAGRLTISGRGVRASAPVGAIAGGAFRTVTIRARFRVRGSVRATFKVSAANAGSRFASKSIRIR